LLEHLLLRFDGRRFIDALIQTNKADTMAANHKRWFARYFPDYPLRLAKLLIVFLATASVPEFTRFVRERTPGGESWDLLFMLLILKLDAYKAGRPMGSRSRIMLSDGRGAEEKRRAASATKATAVPASASASASASAAPVPLPVSAVPRSILPEYCGVAHAVLHMCLLYEC
jgi:hypothetical protein